MNKNTVCGGPVPVLAFVVALIVIVMALASSQPARAAGSGTCVTARVDAPFRLPDGSLHPAGALTLCDGGAYSPVDNFQRILVGGSTIGLFISNRRNAELRSAGAPQVLFNRDAEGILSLVGYTLPSMGQSVAFRLKRPDDAWQASVRRPSGSSDTEPAATIVATTGAR